MKNHKKLVIDSDKETLSALSPETIEKMARATGNPELFRHIISDLRKLALSKKKAVNCKIDTDAFTLSSLSGATVEKMAAAAGNPELFRQLFADLKKAAEAENGKSPNKHIYWSWSGEAV